MLKLLAFVLPLGLDSLAAAAAIGAVRTVRARDRLRISLIFLVFEAGLPLVGLGLGAALASGIGTVAEFLAGGAVVAVGAWMLLAGDDDADKPGRLAGSRGWALVALGLSISMDELAIGFSLGLARIPIAGVVIAIAVQAFAAAQIGLAVGARIGERWRERAEMTAGIALILLGVYLIITRLTG